MLHIRGLFQWCWNWLVDSEPTSRILFHSWLCLCSVFPQPQRVVITCSQDFPRCSIPFRVGLPILSPEFLLTGVLKQEAKPEAFILSTLEMSSSWKCNHSTLFPPRPVNKVLENIWKKEPRVLDRFWIYWPDLSWNVGGLKRFTGNQKDREI